MSREEYDELFLCCVRLTDRIEALERRFGTEDNPPVFRYEGRLLTLSEYQREFADEE